MCNRFFESDYTLVWDTLMLTGSNNQFRNHKSWLCTQILTNQICFYEEIIKNKLTSSNSWKFGFKFGIGCWI